MDLSHLDEHGHPCTRHATGVSDELLALALVGSRMPSFHHDLASKLQGLMMSIDEISELSDVADRPMTRAIGAAQSSLREVLGLLNANRALTKPPVKSRTSLADLVARASERVYLSVRGELPVAMLEVVQPALVHALSLVLDVAGGPGRGRTLDASTVIDGANVVITMAASPKPPSNAAESLALSTFVLRREGGDLSCAGEGTQFVVRVPVAVD